MARAQMNLPDDNRTDKCPPDGFGEKGATVPEGEEAECGCPDFYRITIYNGVDAG